MLLIGTVSGVVTVDGAAVLPATSVKQLASDGKAWWAVTGDHEVRRSDDAQRWTTVADLPDLVARCVAPIDGGAIVGTSEAHLVRVGDGDAVAPVASFDAIPSRDEWYTPWGAPPDIRSLAVSPEGETLVNVHVGGLWRADDLAADGAWRQEVETEADVHQVAADPVSGWEVIAAAIGFGARKPGGTWSFTAEGLHESYARAVAVAGDTVLITASTGPFTKHAAVYRRALAGEGPFERCAAGLPERFPTNIDTFCLAADGPDVAFGTAEGDVYVSADEGATWEQAASGLPAVRCLLFR